MGLRSRKRVRRIKRLWPLRLALEMHPNRQSRASLLPYSRCLLPLLPRRLRRRSLLLRLPRLHPLERCLVLQVLCTSQLKLNLLNLHLHRPREVLYPTSSLIKALLLPLLLSLPLRTRHSRSTSLHQHQHQHQHPPLSPSAPSQPLLRYLVMVLNLIRRKKSLSNLLLARILCWVAWAVSLHLLLPAPSLLRPTPRPRAHRSRLGKQAHLPVTLLKPPLP